MFTSLVILGHSGSVPPIWFVPKYLQPSDELPLPGRHARGWENSHVHQARQIGPGWEITGNLVVGKVPVSVGEETTLQRKKISYRTVRFGS